MRTATLGPVGEVSRLTLGGGGLGQVWGETSDAEVLATVKAALDAGITVIDTAPMYGSCEALIGRAFEGRLPKGVKITTKCYLGEPEPGTALSRLEASLDASLKAMRLDRVDAMFLHNMLCEADSVLPRDKDRRAQVATS